MREKIERIAEEVNNIRTKDDLCFAVISDSRLSECSMNAKEHIRLMDEQVHFDCLVHLGDILRGNDPERVSCRILQEELGMYRKSLGNGKVLVTQGERDGYRDEAFCGQLVCGIMRDDIWHEATAYIDKFENVFREGDKPYYYIDFPEYRTRMIFMCSSFYEFDPENLLYERYPGFDLKQLAWLKNKALQADEGWRILLFSHAMPKSRFDTGNDPYIYKGFATEKLLSLLQKAETEQKVSVVSWCAGHYEYYREAEVASIHHMVIGDTAKQEQWYVAVLKANEKRLHIFQIREDL